MRRYFNGILKSTPSSRPPWRTPDHPPYSQMVEVALHGLSEEGGSTESSISAFIQSTFSGLPWGHDRLLPYYLRKLVASGEVYCPSHDRYQLPIHRPKFRSSSSSFVRCRGRPIHRSNLSSYPTFRPLRSSPSRPRGRPRLLGSRDKSSKDSAKGTPLLQQEQGSAPLRGRPPRRKERDTDGVLTQSLVGRIRRSRGSRIRQAGSRVRNLSPIHALCDDKDNECGESAALDNLESFERTHAQSLPGKAQQILPPEQSSPKKCPPFSTPKLPEFPDHCQGTPFSNDKKSVGPETCVLAYLEKSEHSVGQEGQPFVADQLFEHGEGHFSPVRDVPLLTLDPVKVPPFWDLGLSERTEGKSPEGPSSLVHDQDELFHQQTSPGDGLPSLSPKKPQVDNHGPEKSEDGHKKLSVRKRTALVAFEEGLLQPLPLSDGDEIESHEVSSKDKKARRNRRRLRLWFEG